MSHHLTIYLVLLIDNIEHVSYNFLPLIPYFIDILLLSGFVHNTTCTGIVLDTSIKWDGDIDFFPDFPYI